MAGNTKNVGQVSGVYIGSTPPENIIMIWYDNTPSQMVHKVYNPGLSQWVVLDQNLISSITYSELVNIATNVGLTVGQWFKITDKSNALALAVTSTKVQYSDSLGNILIDDLGSNIQYHVSSSNLSIDDIVGVFDEVNKKLVFQFGEQVPDYTADDYILGKVKRNNVWSLAKFKLSSFLSKVTGNSITWNGGFFFNFSSAITAILDKKGGVVSKNTYDIDKQNIATDIQNVGKENQTIIENANTAISDATSATAIYDKQTPAVETGGEPTDVATGDKLITIVSKFQRYINKFKFATGIRLSSSFSLPSDSSSVNNNDNVQTAISKLQKQHNDIQPLKYNLTRDWDEKSQGTDYIEKILSDSNTIEDILICIEQERRVYKKLEKDWELTTYQVLPNNPTLSSGINYRIRRGTLQILFNSGINFGAYSANGDSNYYFYYITIEQETLNIISDYLPGKNDDNSYLLQKITTSLISFVWNNGDTSSNGFTPPYELKTDLFLCWQKINGVRKLGIAVLPTYRIVSGYDSVNNSSYLTITDSTDKTFFQLLPQYGRFRIDLPKSLIVNYKLF